MYNLAFVILSYAALENDNMIIGGPQKLDNHVASQLYYNTLKHLSSKCNPNDNDLLCNTVSTMKLYEISKATEQIVNGKIYDLNILTNLGNLYMTVWQKTAPVKYVLQTFKIDDTEFLPEGSDEYTLITETS